jgi:hypothetical protein
LSLINRNKLFTADILLAIQFTSLFFTSASVRVARCRSVTVGAEVVLKFVEDLQIYSEFEERGSCVLCDRHYHESYVWP